MAEFVLYVLKLNFLAACFIPSAILAGRAAAQRYLPGWKYTLWLALSLALLFPVNVSGATSVWNLQLPMPEEQSGSAAETAVSEYGQYEAMPEVQVQNSDSGNQIMPAAGRTRAEAPLKTAKKAERPSPEEWFLGIWLVAASALAAFKIFPGRAALRLLKNSSADPDEELCDIYREICTALSMKKFPRLAVNGQISGPFLAGIVHPCIYLPENSYTPNEIRLVLEHELCHYKRKDLWYKLLLNTVSTVYWFNPLLLVMRREAERDMETLCDAAVSAGKNRDEKLQYSRVILKTAVNMQGRKSFLSSGLNDGSLELERRLRTVMNGETYKRGFILALCTVLVFTAGNLLTGCTREHEANAKPEHEVIFYKMDVPGNIVQNKRLEYADIPELAVIDEKKFFWDYEPFGGKEEYGTCERDGNILTLTSPGGEYQWRFQKQEYGGQLTLRADGVPESAALIPNEFVRELFVNGITFSKDYTADTRQNEDGSFEILTPYVFPVGDAYTLSDFSDSERYELLQIPQAEMERLTDRMLLETIMDYPYGGFMGNIEEFAEKFNGMKEFLERPGAGRTLVEEFKEIGIDDSSERQTDIENLIIYFANMDMLSSRERKEFSEEVKDKSSRGYLGCHEYDNPGGEEKTVFLKRLYMKPDYMELKFLLR